MVRIRCSRTLATCTLTQTIGAKNVITTITTDNHLWSKHTHAAGVYLAHTSFGLEFQQFFAVQHDACGKDINLQMSVHMLVITLSGYAEVITEELYTTTFASG